VAITCCSFACYGPFIFSMYYKP